MNALNVVREPISVGLVVIVAALIAVWLAAESQAQTAGKPSIAGAWTRNNDLSDTTGGTSERGEPRDDGGRGRRAGGSGRGGGFGRGGGGGFGRGGMGRGGDMDRESMARMRDAMRDLTNPSNHLTITQTESMVVITAADGRTTRLSPDGQKIKDDNTKIERKTKWDGGKLVSEIGGLGPGKTTQTFSVDPDSHQLRITVQMEGGRAGQARTITNIYDADAR